ncbi:MAG: hypothetical protein IJQ87_01910, partial [Clostridia bacterium]|nr:hypothetical protein [Clostridia bacterium]
MNRKKILEKRLARLNEKKSKLSARAMASQDVNEVRSINEELADVNAEIEETQAEINAIDEEATQPTEERAAVPAGATLVNGSIVGAFTQGANATEEKREDVPETGTM